MRFIKGIGLFVVIAALAAAAQASAGALVDQALQGFGHLESSARLVRIVALMNPSAQGIPSPRRYDHEGVAGYLRATAERNWKQVVSYLDASHLDRGAIQNTRVYTVNSSIVADVTPAGLRALASCPVITKIYADREISLVRPAPGRRDNGFRTPFDAMNDMPYDWKDTGLDKLISERSNINGAGVILGQVDTGVDGKHPALQGKILKFYDVHSKKITDPVDSDEHGTHTAGTMVGGDYATNRIGMAPGAKLISTGPLSDYGEMVDAMQFIMDPDQNGHSTDVPRAVNNSWNCSGAPDMEVFYRAISAWDAAGILPVFSAGNNGPGPGTITNPHEHPLAFAVGATGEDGKVANYSSRGPGNFDGKPTQKPDLAAPGNNIRSSIPGGGYEQMSGTSMAAPHVTGTTALLFQANPALTPQQVREILVKSTEPVDENGNPGRSGIWNAAYGFGKLNIYNAVKMALTVRSYDFGIRPFNALPMFSTPEDWDAHMISEVREPDSVANVFAFPEKAEIGHGWVTLD